MLTIRLTDHEMNKLTYANFLVQLEKVSGKLMATVRDNALIGAVGVILTDCRVSCEPEAVDSVLTLCWQFGMTSLDAETVLHSIDWCQTRLHQAGWTTGIAWVKAAGKPLWQVDGTNGENVILARGGTQTAAWNAACRQAESLGMLRRG